MDIYYIEIAARNYFDSIVITRRWNAEYGGVYVLKKEGMASNPYLKNPDITSRDGLLYTMKNPALMTREISDMARKNGGYQYHITSLKLMNPDNGPDEWEKEALLGFEAGSAEAVQVVDLAGRKVFRLMQPLYYETGCISCHDHQGYRDGEVRGGISVTLPYDEIAASLTKNRLQMLILAALILVCFMAVFYFGVWRLLSRLAATNALLVKEREELEQLNGELDRKVEERNGTLLAVNQQLRDSLAEREEKERNIQRLNAELEQRVQERTIELTNKTEALLQSQKATQNLLKDVSEAKIALEAEVAEIERMNRIFVHRELRMVELKERIRALEQNQPGAAGAGPGG